VEGFHIPPQETISLSPKEHRTVLERVRPKRKETPQTEHEAREYYSSVLRKLRWVIADDKRIPNFAVLYNKTIESMLDSPPSTLEELLSLPEFKRNRSNIKGYEPVILEILHEFMELITKLKKCHESDT